MWQHIGLRLSPSNRVKIQSELAYKPNKRERLAERPARHKCGQKSNSVNNFPISVAELAEGMNNAGSALAAAGNSFDQSVALLTASNVTVQNISKSSTGLRTIAARIRKTTTELDDLGEVINEAKYQQIIDLLTGNGVKLTENGEYRSTYDILKDIADIWDRLSSMDQAAIAEQLAGNRQQNIFYSIIGQFREAEGAMEAMQKSQGAMESAYDERMDSIEAHMDRFKAAYEELSQSFIDEDLSKSAIDFGKTILNLLTQLSDALGGMKSVLPVVSGLVSTFISSFTKSKAFGSLIKASGIEDVTASFKRLGAVLKTIGTDKWSGLGGLWGALGTPTKIGAIVAGLTLIATVIKGIYDKKQQQSFEALLNDAEKAKDEYESLRETIVDNQIRIAELNELKGTSGWTEEIALEVASLEQENELLAAQKEHLREIVQLKREDAREAAENAVDSYLAPNDASVWNNFLSSSAFWVTRGSVGKATTDELLKYYNDAKESRNTAGVEVYYDKLVERRSELYNTLKQFDPARDADKFGRLSESIMDVNEALGIGRVVHTNIDSYNKTYAEVIDRLQELSAGGAVDLTVRPRIDTSELSEWGEAGGNIATIFSSTYSNEDGTIAANFTPIVVDENGKYIGVMNPDVMQKYAEDVINGVHEDDLGLQIGMEFRGNDAIAAATEAAITAHELQEVYLTDEWEELYNQSVQGVTASTEELATKTKSASDKIKDSIKDMLKSEDFEKQKDTLVEASKTINGISAKNIADAAEKSSELADLLRMDGMNAQFAALILQREFTSAGSGIALVTEDALRLNKTLDNIIGRAQSATAALQAFADATSTEKGDAATSYVEAYQAFIKDWKSGKTGTNTVEAAVKLFLPDSELRELDYDLQAAGEKLSGELYQAIFATTGDPGHNFANYIRTHLTDELKEVVDITQSGGSFSFAVRSVEGLAEALHLDVNAVQAALDALDAFGVQIMMTGEEAEELAHDLGLVDSSADNITKIKTAIEGLAGLNRSEFEIVGVLEALDELGYIDINAEEVTNLGELIGDAVEKLKTVDETETKPKIDVNDSQFNSKMSAAESRIQRFARYHSTATIDIIENHITKGTTNSAASRTQWVDDTQAEGTRNAPGGRTLVNELGPELISQNGHAFIANGGRPAVVNLDRGAVVLNADETKAALSGRKINGVIGAYASGSPTAATIPYYYSGGGSGGSSSGSSSSSSSSKSSDSSSEKKEKTWFEKQYDYHKHLVEMDQELQSDFLYWLDEAYKKAYAEGIIDLEEYMSKEEEVYKGRQDQFKDYISDLDYAIDMAKKAGANSEDVANMYQKMLDEINRALEIAFARGLDENDDYVQYLQNQWYNYYDNLKEAREDAQDDAMDAVDDLVQYRIKMLKQYIKNEVDSLKERLSNLKDFYSKQKDLLKDVADTEDYLDEQSEKRKSVTDIESQLAMLDLDNSAWAQKRKAKLKEELADAQKELNKFERDHAIEVASDQLDAAYEVQERAINARIDELNDLADNPKALYDKALSDVRNNSVALYEEMIEFNNKYGLIPWLLHKVICVNNHTYMRGHLKAIYQNGWLRHQDGWCESRKNIWIAYGATLSA